MIRIIINFFQNDRLNLIYLNFILISNLQFFHASFSFIRLIYQSIQPIFSNSNHLSSLTIL
jgi:hypothetical protein